MAGFWYFGLTTHRKLTLFGVFKVHVTSVAAVSRSWRVRTSTTARLWQSPWKFPARPTLQAFHSLPALRDQRGWYLLKRTPPAAPPPPHETSRVGQRKHAFRTNGHRIGNRGQRPGSTLEKNMHVLDYRIRRVSCWGSLSKTSQSMQPGMKLLASPSRPVR